MRGRAAAPKGTNSCRIQVTFVCLSFRPSIRPSPQVLSGLKSAPSSLKSALSGLKSALSGLESERADFRPERADSRPERKGVKSERADFRPERAYSRPERADFRPERAWGEDKRINERKSPLIYRTLSPSGPLPKNRMKWHDGRKIIILFQADYRASWDVSVLLLS